MKNFQEICQKNIKIAAWMEPRFSRMPGVNPLKPCDWLFSDDVFSKQMEYRDHLILTEREAVFKSLPGSEAACEELLKVMIDHLVSHDYHRTDKGVIRPDGVEVILGEDHPLIEAGRLTQHDLCVMEEDDVEHKLSAACLCFPSSWSLDEKIGRPLIKIHEPVPSYNEQIAKRVQRLFDAIRVDHPIFRVNTLIYSDPNLHQPRTMSTRRKVSTDNKLWLRSEFQTLIRMPISKAVIFCIHNTIVPMESLSKAQQEQLEVKDLIHAYGVSQS